MQNRNLALSLLFLAVVVSGCADNSGKVSGEAISVSGPTVQPSEIFEGASVQTSISVKNNGEIPGQILVGDNGEKVMTNYCPDFFSVENFQAYSSRNSETAKDYTLEPGERVQMNWELNQEGVDVPLNGYPCDLKFQVPFNYSVQAYQQLQIKERDSEAKVDLSSKTSQGPLSIAIETIGSSSRAGSPIFLAEDNPKALIQLVNEQPENSIFKGLIKVRDLQLESSGVKLQECSNFEQPIRINRNQMSKVIRCDITDTDLGGTPSKRAEISASADYTYIKNVGSKRVKVKYGGN
jgi:hypothetical protein